MDGSIHTLEYGTASSAISEVVELPFLHSSARSFRRGEVIARAGVLIDMFARVERGFVSARTTLADGREFIVEIVPKGGLIGELEVLHRQESNLEYQASTDCDLHFFEGRTLREACATDPNFQAKVFSRALARVYELELRIVSNAAASLQSRLASVLLRLCVVYGNETTRGPDELTISQHDLAATLPASREKVNQCLRRFREKKIIEAAQGKIHVLNRRALEAYAEGGCQ